MNVLPVIYLASMLFVGVGIAAAQSPSPEPERQHEAEASLARFTSPSLRRFGSEREFREYVAAARAAARARGNWWAESGRIQWAQAQDEGVSDASTAICPDNDPECLRARPDGDAVIVTGSRVGASNPSITNNQMAGVEEGDIVKQIGRFLLILQDGRIFVADTRRRGGGLALVDRMNVYRDSDDDIWYDEMLVFGDRVLVTGYSYGEDATELSVFRLDAEGRLSREGVFFLSSDDYYSTSNYATRLIGDRLVIYTPFSVLAMADPDFNWPVVRRWLPEAERDEAATLGRPLFDAGGIFRPVRDVSEPVVHTVSVCPLNAVGAAGDLECRTTAFVGPERAQWYVSDTDAYLWMTDYPGARGREIDRRCGPQEVPQHDEVISALLYRVPIADGVPGLIAARGDPIDQFSLQAGQGRFRALLRRSSMLCWAGWDAPASLFYFDVDLDSFSARLEEAPRTQYTPLPGTGTRWIANRFTDEYLVYGGLSPYRSALPEIEEAEYEERAASGSRGPAMPPAFVVPVDRPRGVRPLDVRQTVIRVERVGDDIAVTGYRDRQGLRVSLIDLRRTPRIGSTTLLPGRFESEGRSHAFNSIVEADSSGLIGVPTVPQADESGRWWWRSQASDLSYLALNSDRSLVRLGELESRSDLGDDEDGNPDYECEVSCIDWYGNSRPIFTGGRVFALTGTELIEGRVRGDRIREVRRLDLTMPPRNR